MDNQGILRCAVAIGQAKNRAHFFVFQVYEGDRLYMIMRFKDQLQTQLDLYKQKSAKQQTASASMMVEFDELLTKEINAQEHKVARNNALNSIVVNEDFESSFIVTAT